MNTPAYNAWKFGFPENGTDAAGLTITLQGGIEMIGQDAAIRQSLLMLLSIRPGERVMRPDYGCNLERLVFAPNDDTTAGLAIHYVRQAIRKWEPRIHILSIDAHTDETQPEQLTIVLHYRVNATQHTDTVTRSINLSGRGY